MRIRGIVWLVLGSLVLVAGCVSSPVKLPPPTLTQEEILDNKQAGSFAGEAYNQQAVQERLQKMPKEDSPEEVYAYILSLVGEGYINYRETYDSLEKSNVSQQLPQEDSNAVTHRDLLNTTNLSLCKTYYNENIRLDATVAYLRDEMNYGKWFVIDEWVVYRWTMLTDYQMEKDLAIARKILDESI